MDLDSNPNLSYFKLLRIVGTPWWFQRAFIKQNPLGDHVLQVFINAKPPTDELDRIPDDVDGYKVRIIYRNPVKVWQERFSANR